MTSIHFYSLLEAISLAPRLLALQSRKIHSLSLLKERTRDGDEIAALLDSSSI